MGTILIHANSYQDLFRTSDEDPSKLNNSSYLDGPLYGHNYEEQALVRTFKDGFNKPVTFAEIRLLGFPSGLPHYWMTREQLEKYKTPENKLDNDLFQTARLNELNASRITCGLYVNVIFFDYVRTILNLNRTSSYWLLDPRTNPPTVYCPHGIPEGIGNQDFVRDSRTSQEAEQRTFGGLTRQADGTFKDAELVKLIYEGTEDVAAACNVPVIMRAVEIFSIQQARSWNVATLNEFRKFFGLKPHEHFSDISSIRDVAQSLETLYKDVNHVELYPGLVAEDAKPRQYPGSGICPGYTISRVILADAVALVRDDRFYTLLTEDYNSATMTNWGFNQIQSNPNIAGCGVIYKLLMRAFPGYYHGNSVYALFPFTVPDETRVILRKVGKEAEYDFNKPRLIPNPTLISTWTSIVGILEDLKRFKIGVPILCCAKTVGFANDLIWGKHTYELIKHDYMLSGDEPTNTEQRNFVDNALYSPENAMEEVTRFCGRITSDLLRERSRKLRHSFSVMLLKKAQQSTEAFAKVAIHVCQLVHDERFHALREFLGLREHDVMPQYRRRLIERLFHGGNSVDEVASGVIATAAAAVATQAQAVSNVFDCTNLEDAIGWTQNGPLTALYHAFQDLAHNLGHWSAIKELARSDDSTAFAKLKRYALEGFRLATPAPGLLRVAADDVVIKDGLKAVNIKKGNQVFANFEQACVDKDRFTDPPDSSYIHQGYGPHACLGHGITVNCMAAQLKVFGKLENMRRAPGGQGFMKYKIANGALRMYMKEDWSDWWSYPSTMKIMFDDFE
ncbi:Psi-producing oxygenase A [Lipomyces tetrasporus]